MVHRNGCDAARRLAVRHQRASFAIADEHQEHLLGAMRAMAEPAGDAAQDRRTLEHRLERVKELYDWGDYSRERYLAERAAIQVKLQVLAAAAGPGGDVEALAAVLRSVKAAWEAADQEEKNQLVRMVLDEVRILDDRVLSVTPRPSFAPFFHLDRVLREQEETPQQNCWGSTGFVPEAEATGFEPAISALTGLHVRPLHHASAERQEHATRPPRGVSTQARPRWPGSPRSSASGPRRRAARPAPTGISRCCGATCPAPGRRSRGAARTPAGSRRRRSRRPRSGPRARPGTRSW